MNEVVNIVTSEQIERLQEEMSKYEQYEPITNHYFHGGMYCREVTQDADVLVVGKVHKKEHFFMVAEGLIRVNTDSGMLDAGAGTLIMSKPGAKRAILSLTPARYMTFHRLDEMTIEQAEAELVEDDPKSMFLVGNKKRQEVLT